MRELNLVSEFPCAIPWSQADNASLCCNKRYSGVTLLDVLCLTMLAAILWAGASRVIEIISKNISRTDDGDAVVTIRTNAGCEHPCFGLSV